MEQIKYFSIKLLLLFCACLLVSSSLQAQSFQNLTVRQSEDTLYVFYDIFGGREYDLYKIKMEISLDGGISYDITPTNAMGDIKYGISRGLNKRVYWEPLKEGKQINGENIVVRLSGEVLGTSDMLEFVNVNGGEFLMGDNYREGFADETVIHKIKLYSFEISKYEVTNHQFALFLSQYGDIYVEDGEFKGERIIYELPRGLKFIQGEWKPEAGFEYHPVIGVTWFGANEFCRYYGFRLPSEAEWEFAAREGGKIVRFGNGKDFASAREINFDGSFVDTTDFTEVGENRRMTVNVGGFAPNNINIFQMSGNVWEWCQDWYKLNYYLKGPELNPRGPNLGRYKIIRGGSWFNSAKGVRVTERSFIAPYKFKGDIGFRIVRELTGDNIKENISMEDK